MSKIIKIEQHDPFSGKFEDDNNLKCGEIVFSNNVQFCFSCVFCQKVFEKIHDFFRHVLYDHLNYLDDFQFSDEGEYSINKISEPIKPKHSLGDMEFIDVNFDENTAKMEKIDFMKHFEDYVTDIPISNYVKTEIHDEEYTDSEFPSSYDASSNVKVLQAHTSQNNPQDILHIEILESSSGNDYELENITKHSSENTSEHHNSIYDNEDGNPFSDEPPDTQLDSEEELYQNTIENKIPTEEKPYKCPHCSKVYISEVAVKRHIGNIHCAKPNRLSCEKCPKTFKSEAQLELHINRHLGVKPHHCEICGSFFSDKSNLNVHILRHKGIKPHKCTMCDKRFHSTTERKLHMRSHTGERPFVCEVCGRKFSNSGHLCSHRRRHFGEKRFKCDHCEKRFFDRKLLNDHKVMHSDERPFSCDSCGSTFQRKKALLQHEKLHSDVKQYVCKLCGKSFAQNAGLYSHMKYH